MFEKQSLEQFVDAAKEFLSKQNINYLRAYGRSVGVEKPTEKKKEGLIQAIVAIKTGTLRPIEQSTRGAPLRNDYYPPEIPKYIEKLENLFLRKADPKHDMPARGTIFSFDSDNRKQLEELEGNPLFIGRVHRGQLQIFNNIACLLPLDCGESQENVILSTEQMEKYDLREGDIVTCNAKQGEHAYVADKILTRNELVLTQDDARRKNFDECSPCYPKEKLCFVHSEKKNSVAMKYLDWVFPIGKGQRGCIVASPKSGKTTLLYDMAKAIPAANKSVTLLVLLVDQSPENAVKFRSLLQEDNLVCTTYEDEPEKQVFAADFLLKRAKRLVESGREVVLLIDSFNALARAYNDTDASSGGKLLEGGLESKTVYYLKKFFASARCLQEGGSLTIIGTVSSGTGNPADDVICRELTAVANLDIRFNDALAARRVYPAFDLLSSHAQNESLYQTQDLEGYLRLDYLPAYGTEKLLSALQESQSFAEFLSKIKN